MGWVVAGPVGPETHSVGLEVDLPTFGSTANVIFPSSVKFVLLGVLIIYPCRKMAHSLTKEP